MLLCIKQATCSQIIVSTQFCKGEDFIKKGILDFKEESQVWQWMSQTIKVLQMLSSNNKSKNLEINSLN